jgi:hypothetical protein
MSTRGRRMVVLMFIPSGMRRYVISLSKTACNYGCSLERSIVEALVDRCLWNIYKVLVVGFSATHICPYI